jgi:hypothetical protein
MTCTAGAKFIPRKQHTKLTSFVARVSIAQWCQPFLSVCVRSTPIIDDVEESFLASIFENLRHCIQRCYCWLEFARRLTPQAEATRANYNSNVLCSKSLSSVAEDEAGEGFSVEVQIYLIDMLLRDFPRTQFTAL